MNLNYFVAVPNKPNSMKMKGRNLPELHLDAVQLDQESRIIENRLQQLREDMSREKEEREKSGGFRWKSVKAASQGATKTKENSFQKLSAGKVKMRVLKGEPEEAGRPTGKAPRPPPGEQATSRKPRLRGKPCGQCEARAARLMCAECGEDYCVGCFAKFHQKGALKNHRMVPIQMEIQTSISALDVVSQFKRQIEPEGSAVNSKRKDAKWSQGALKSKSSSTSLPQTQPLLTESDGAKAEREEAEIQRRQNLLGGAFDEKESERSFQEALWEWRRQSGASEMEAELEAEPQPEAEPGPEEVWGLTETLKVPTEVFAGQADLVRKGQPITVEFKEHGLTYMEKLLVKKHRRTPVEEYRPVLSASSYQESLMDPGCLTDEEGLTAEEMELRRYCASLFTTDAAPCTTASTSDSTSVPAYTSSNQLDRPAKSCLSTVQLEQMAGDSAVQNSTFTAELETDTGMTAEAEGVPMEPGCQETKRSEETTGYQPSSPLTRPPLSTPSPQNRMSHLTQSPQAPLSSTPAPRSPHSSTPLSARAMTASLETKATLRNASWSAPCQVRPPRSAGASRQPSPSPLSSRPKSTGSSLRNPLPSRFNLTRSLLPELTSRAIATSSPPPTSLTSRSSSTPLSYRVKSADFSSRSKTTASPPSTGQSFSSISTGSLPPTPLSSRDKSDESPPPDYTSRSEETASPPSTAHSFRSVSNRPSLSMDKSSELQPPELNFRGKSCHSAPLELAIRGKSPGRPSPPTPRCSSEKSPESPAPELDFRNKSARSSLPDLSFRDISPGSTLPEQDFRDEYAELSFRDTSPALTVPEQDFRDELAKSPIPELNFRDKSPGTTQHESDFRDESPRLPLAELSFKDKSPDSPQPEISFRDKSHASPPSECNKSPESLPPTPLSTRSGSPTPPPSELRSVSRPEPRTSPEALLSVSFPQCPTPSAPAQLVLTESIQPLSSANRLSPALSSEPRSRRESASGSETRSGGPETPPHRGDEDAAIGEGSDSEPDIGTSDQPVFFSDPSLALHSLAFRPLQYRGLDGFLTLGLDPEPGCATPSPLSARQSQEAERPVERLVGGPERWRPGSSLRDRADERLVHGVMSGRPIGTSPRAAEPRPSGSDFSGAVEGRPRSARNAPRTARPISADSSSQPRPRPRPQSSPWPRPQSQAAKEILEIEWVDRGEGEDPLLGDEDCLALASLEEEFRLMSRRGARSSIPGASVPPHGRGRAEGSSERTASKRKESSEGHTDEEDEILRDKQNVALLP